LRKTYQFELEDGRIVIFIQVNSIDSYKLSMHQIYSEKQGFHFTVFPADFIDWEVERQRYFVDCDERIFRPIDVSSDIDFLFPNSKSVEQ